MVMRQRIVDKLRDRGGVTILMALFAMLVASLVCIVILGAAVTTVKQAKTDEAHEQATLTLQSAGELVRSEIVKTGIITFSGTDADELAYSSCTTNTSMTSVQSGAIAAALSSGGEGERTFAVRAQSTDGPEPSFSSEVEGLLVVSLEGADSFRMTVTLSTVDANGNTQFLYLKFTDCGQRYYQVEIPVLDENKQPTGGSYTEHYADFKYGTPRFYLAEDASSNG